VRRLLKILHEIGSIGFMGAMATLVILVGLAPPPSSIAQYALICDAMGQIGKWILLPSLTLTLAAGLASIGVNRAFHNAGWAWAKAATGILVFAGGLHALAPIQDQASESADALAGKVDPATLAGAFDGEQTTLWVLLLVSTANIVLGVWRPRFTRASA
jgi:hypothetical protein